MIKYELKKNNNPKMANAYKRYYAFPVVEDTIDLAGLAKHMENHNTGFSEAMCTGVIKAMVKCIKEMILDGKNVKIDDLAIFSCGIKNNCGSETEEQFTVKDNIQCVKLRARATGTLNRSNLNLEASLRRVSRQKTDGSTPDKAGSGE